MLSPSIVTSSRLVAVLLSCYNCALSGTLIDLLISLQAALNASVSSQSMLKDLFPPSPTSPECPAFSLPEASAPFFRHEHVQRPYQLSSNPPNPRSAFRHGDWM